LYRRRRGRRAHRPPDRNRWRRKNVLHAYFGLPACIGAAFLPRRLRGKLALGVARRKRRPASAE
jgi:hypothetical protein